MAKQNDIGVRESKGQFFFQTIRMPAPVGMNDCYFSPFEFESDLVRKLLSDSTGVSVPEDSHEVRCQAPQFIKHTQTDKVTTVDHPLRLSRCLLNTFGQFPKLPDVGVRDYQYPRQPLSPSTATTRRLGPVWVPITGLDLEIYICSLGKKGLKCSISISASSGEPACSTAIFSILA